MRGNSCKNVVAENIHGMSAQSNTNRWMNSQWKMCWKCQKDKNPHGGYLRIAVGLHKFICKDCMDAKGEKA